MQLLIYGPGRLGGAVAAAARARAWPDPVLIGRPCGEVRVAAPLVDVVVDTSRGEAVASNLAHALAAGNRCVILAATGWDADRGRVRELLLANRTAAVVAPNLALGAALFLRLAETAAAWYGAAGGFDPSIVEWHRRGKADRPSGTARSLAGRIATADPRWAAPGGPVGERAPIEVAGIRAGSAPGTHLVTFDGAGESVELRLTARDRTAYAEGALAAARWLVRERRAPGLHAFDAVVDDLLATSRAALTAGSEAIPDVHNGGTRT
jgi:4-hydroxy-tetrahydrodipicolinate reductase